MAVVQPSTKQNKSFRQQNLLFYTCYWTILWWREVERETRRWKGEPGSGGPCGFFPVWNRPIHRRDRRAEQALAKHTTALTCTGVQREDTLTANRETLYRNFRWELRSSRMSWFSMYFNDGGSMLERRHVWHDRQTWSFSHRLRYWYVEKPFTAGYWWNSFQLMLTNVTVWRRSFKNISYPMFPLSSAPAIAAALLLVYYDGVSAQRE